MVTLFGVFGIVGITATVGIKPNVVTSLTCGCLPSTLVRFQELAICLLGVAIALIPLGLLESKGGPTDHLGPKYQGMLPSGRSYDGPPIKNGGMLAVGVTLVVFGIGVIPVSYLVLKDYALIAEGVGMVVLGIVFVLRGGRPT